MIIKQKNKKSISGAKIFIVFETRNTIINALTQNIRICNDCLIINVCGGTVGAVSRISLAGF